MQQVQADLVHPPGVVAVLVVAVDVPVVEQAAAVLDVPLEARGGGVHHAGVAQGVVAAEALGAARLPQGEGGDVVGGHDLLDVGRQEGVAAEDGDRGGRSLQRPFRGVVGQRAFHAMQALDVDVEVRRQVIVRIGEGAVARQVRIQGRDGGAAEVVARAAIGDRLAARRRTDRAGGHAAGLELIGRAVRIEGEAVERGARRIDQAPEGRSGRHHVRTDQEFVVGADDRAIGLVPVAALVGEHAFLLEHLAGDQHVALAPREIHAVGA